jgi:hypothetical protein
MVAGARLDVVEWLLDSDPAIRWQLMRDFTDATDEEVLRWYAARAA